MDGNSLREVEGSYRAVPVAFYLGVLALALKGVGEGFEAARERLGALSEQRVDMARLRSSLIDDLVGQIAWSHHWMEVQGRLVRHAAPYRFVWPSELDLMARLAGLRLRSRWADWERSPFTSDSSRQVAAFEKEFAQYVDAPHACAVSNCTTALHLALSACGVGAGDEVVTVSHSFIATANAIRSSRKALMSSTTSS